MPQHEHDARLNEEGFAEDTLFEDEVREKDADETGEITEAQAGQAVVYATDWTAETLIGQLTNENIDVKPKFQRRDVWTLQKKSRFIESLILGLPVPQIVLAEEKGSKGKFIVLDGRQRLLTLLQYSNNSNDNSNGFKLDDLIVAKRLNGITYNDLVTRHELEADLRAFHNVTVRSVVIRNWPNDDYLNMVFVRLNSSNVTLSPQELRQALVPGEFTTFLDQVTSTMSNLQTLLGNRQADFRMRDVEICLRHLAFKLSDDKYAGNMRKFLDDFCRSVNATWERRQVEIKDAVNDFDAAISVMFDVFGKNAARKWTGDEYERRPNRAVMDVLLYYFSDQTVAKLASTRKDDIEAAFKDACKDPDFRASVELTTKSIAAVKRRFGVWKTKLERTLNIGLESPQCIPG